MKAVVAVFNQEKALVGAFSVITNLRMELFQPLLEDCLDCLEHTSVGGYLDDVSFKATAARDDAESWLSQLQEGTL